VEEVVGSGRTPRAGFMRRFSAVDLEAIDRAMEVADVSGLRKRPVGELSGGELQRVYIARALAAGPELLILDEPAVGVDVAAQEAFYSFLAELNQGHGITVVFVSHDVGVVAREVSSILCLNRRLLCHGRPENFIKEDFLETLYGKKVKSVYHRHE
jgi:zinc transport system ATP-binding protein